MKYLPKYSKELLDTISNIDQKKDIELFLKDLLTPKEYKEVAMRWQIIKKLSKNETQRSIADDLGVGIATVTRGSRTLSNEKGGFAKTIKDKK